MHLNLEARSMSEKEVMFDIVGDIAKDVKGKQSVTNADVDRVSLKIIILCFDLITLHHFIDGTGLNGPHNDELEIPQAACTGS